MLKNAAIVAAIIGALGAILVPVVTRLVSQKPPSTPAYKTAPSSPSSLQIPAHKKSPTASKTIVQSGDDDTFDDHSNNSGQQVGSITGSNNQVNQVYGSNGVTINQLPPASSHPVTNDMGLKWNMDDFAETVRNGNSLPAIKEYLNARDGFSPNALWNGNVFVLELPIFEGTKNFPEILKLFRDTGKLNWKEVNERAVLGGMYAHPITFEFSALQQAASKDHPSDLKALIDAGANPSQLVADEVAAFNRASEGALLYKGTLTGRARDSSGAHAEQELATFKTIGYPLPALEQTVRNASQSPAACEQDIRNRHTFQEAIALAKKPEQASSGQNMEWDSFRGVVSYLRDKLRYGPLAWQGDTVEYARAVATACSKDGNF